MDEEEHEVYGGEIPDVGEMEGDMDSHNADVDMSAADDDAVKVFFLLSFFFFFPYFLFYFFTLSLSYPADDATYGLRRWQI